MRNPEFKKMRDQVIKAMQISGERLIAKKKALGQKMVISENGVIKEVDPRDLK
ncbi:MAG: hypothetical protein K0S09_2802 [Sphingobacteriaceae bacterium]|jgi:hypothetical protein|nr:hypothetical protein [Sphingobacteriaceae bacterium]